MSSPLLLTPYARLWAGRAAELRLARGYGVGVALLALPGLLAALVAVVAAAVQCCPCRCPRCPPPRPRARARLRPRRAALWTGALVGLLLAALAALWLSFAGVVRAGTALQNLDEVLSPIADFAYRVAVFIIRYVDIIVEAAPVIEDVLRDLAFELVLPTAISLGLQLNLANAEDATDYWTAYINAILGQTQSVLYAMRDALCLLPSLLVGTHSGLIMLVLLGQGVAMAGGGILIVAILRGKRNAVAVGTIVLLSGLAIALITFGLSTPMSVGMDDACYTLHRFIAENEFAALIFECVQSDLLRNPIVAVLNSTDFVMQRTVAPVLEQLALPALNLTADFTIDDNVMLLEAYRNNTISPMIQYLVNLNTTGYDIKTTGIITFGGLFLAMMRFFVEFLIFIGDCSGLFFQQWIEYLDRVVCTDLPQGLFQVVWGMFACMCCMLIAMIVYLVGRPFLSSDRMPAVILFSLALAGVSGTLSLVFGIMHTLDNVVSAAENDLFYASFAVFLILFVLLALPGRWLKQRHKIFFGLQAGAALVTLAFGIALVALLVPRGQQCWVTDESSCQFECSTMQVSGIITALIVASWNVLASLVLGIIGIVCLVRPPKLWEVFTGLEKDWVEHAVDTKELQKK